MKVIDKSVSCEIGYVLVGETKDGVWHVKMMWRRLGAPAEVDFDWQRVMTREEEKGDIVGFYHTHPKGYAQPSARDDKTMEAWSTCFGKPLLCLIDAGSGVLGWIYDADKENKKRVFGVRKFRGNWLVAIE